MRVDVLKGKKPNTDPHNAAAATLLTDRVLAFLNATEVDNTPMKE